MKLNIIISFFLPFLFISCSDNKTGIGGSNNSNNQIIIGDNATIIKADKKLSFAPDTVLNLVQPNSSIEKLNELFGAPKKIFPKSEDSKYFTLFYDLDNCLILIHSIDNIVVSSICIQSKGVEPFVKVGFGCPIDFDEKYLLLGKSKFTESFSTEDNNNYLTTGKIEVGRDRCNEFIVDVYFTGRLCSYNYVAYGSFIAYSSAKLPKYNVEDEEPVKGKQSNNENIPFFENSQGIGFIHPSDSMILDYVIIGEDNAIKEHKYGEGVHCDYLYMK